MKTTFLVAAITACTLSSIAPAPAQDAADPAKPAMSMEMGTQMSRMQENMSAAQQQMDNFRGTTDPVARRNLMRDHMQTMQDSMKLMHEMDGPTMMGSAQGNGMQMPPGPPMANGEMRNHRDMMQGHMKMMQMMLELMVQQDQMMMESIPTN
jgi:hypothetical protein